MTRRDARGWYILLLIPFIAVLWVPSFSGASPQVAGIPFFYWYQFLWVLISAVLTAIVYFLTGEPTAADNAIDEPLNEELA
jgi:Protein of unknown function (DUF3311)